MKRHLELVVDNEARPAERPRVRGDCWKWRLVCKCCDGSGLEADGDTIDRSNGQAVRDAESDPPSRNISMQKFNGADVAVQVRLRKHEEGARGESTLGGISFVRLRVDQARGVHRNGQPGDVRIQRVALDDGALLHAEDPKSSELRRAGDQGLQSMARGGELSEGYGAEAQRQALSRSDRQRRKLHPEKLPVGDAKRTSAKQAQQPCARCEGTGLHYIRVGGKNGPLEEHDQNAYRAWVEQRESGDDPGPLKPCVFCLCRQHLYLDVHPQSGNIKFNAPDLFEMSETCALDVAARGGSRLQDSGDILNVTREGIRQLEKKAKARFRKRTSARLRAYFETAEASRGASALAMCQEMAGVDD